MVKVKKERQSNIELLRIISMLMIVIHHFAVHGKLNYRIYNSQIIDVEKVLAIFQSFGKIGVDIFVLIGAYFLVGKQYKSSRIVSLLLMSFFYSIVICTIFIVFKLPLGDDSHSGIIYLFFSVVLRYWFVWAYIIMLIFMSILNMALQQMHEKQLRCVLIALTVMWVIMPQLNTYFLGKLVVDLNAIGYSDGIFFIYLYLIAAYLKLYPNSLTKNVYINLLVAALIFVGIYFSIEIPTNYANINPEIYNLNEAMLQGNSLFTVLASIAIFNVFLNIDIGKIKIINRIAASTFAVYLIHDNSLIREVLWGYLDNSKIHNADAMLLYGVKAMIVVFIICILIDISRRIVLGWLFKWLETKIGNLIDKRLLADK